MCDGPRHLWSALTQVLTADAWSCLGVYAATGASADGLPAVGALIVESPRSQGSLGCVHLLTQAQLLFERMQL